MKTFETHVRVGQACALTLEYLPFADGQAVHVRIEPRLQTPTTKSRILGLHEGQVLMGEDFEQPLPDSFWLGEDADGEASA